MNPLRKRNCCFSQRRSVQRRTRIYDYVYFRAQVKIGALVFFRSQGSCLAQRLLSPPLTVSWILTQTQVRLSTWRLHSIFVERGQTRVPGHLCQAGAGEVVSESVEFCSSVSAATATYKERRKAMANHRRSTHIVRQSAQPEARIRLRPAQTFVCATQLWNHLRASDSRQSGN